VDRITLLLADDNLIVREGVGALLGRDPALEVVGLAADYDELVDGAVRLRPQVIVTDIRMLPTFQDEASRRPARSASACRARGVVVLSQYDDPEYAIRLLDDGRQGTPTCSRTASRTPDYWGAVPAENVIRAGHWACPVPPGLCSLR
jgi:adenylate cyclase